MRGLKGVSKWQKENRKDNLYRCNFKFNVEKWKVRSLIKGKIKSEDDCYYLLELIEDCYSWSQAKEVIEEVLS